MGQMGNLNPHCPKLMQPWEHDRAKYSVCICVNAGTGKHFPESPAPKNSNKPCKIFFLLHVIYFPLLFTFEYIKKIFLLKWNSYSNTPYILLGCCMALLEFLLFHGCNFLSRKIICRRYVFCCFGETISQNTLLFRWST